MVSWARRPLVNGHIRYDHKGQNPHQHERHSDGDDGPHHGVVAPIRAEQPAQATSDPARRSAYIHHRGWDDSPLHGTHVTTRRRLGFLTLFGQGEGAGLDQAVRWRVLQQQLALAALEADGQCPLHVRGESANDVLVVAEAGQVLAVGDLGQLTANGAGQGLELRRDHIYASEALKTESVATRQQLWRLEDVVVCAETNGALGVLHIVFWGLHLPPVALSFLFSVPSPGLLTPPPPPPTSLVPVYVSPPASFRPVRVGAPGSPHFGRLLLPPLLLPTATFFLAEFGFDIGGLSGPMTLAPFRSVSLPVITHDRGMTSEVEACLESDLRFSNWSCGEIKL